MKNENKQKSQVSRRKFLGSTAAVAALSMAPLNFSFKPDSYLASEPKAGPDFGGVHVGTITYSWRSMPGGIENIIKYCKETAITTVELMSGDAEEYLGAPKNPMMAIFASMKPAPGPPPGPPAGNAPGGNPPAGGFQRPKLTPEQEASIAKYKEDVKAWRIALPVTKYEAIRKMFDTAGISIHIIKFSPAQWSDEEIDYAFKAAKILGAKGVSEEIGEASVKRLAPFAEKHGLYAIFHQHMQFATAGFSYDPFIAISPAVRFNFDAGHFFGSTGLHPNTIIEKYHDKIINIHIKDKTGPKTDPANTNQVWGQGEMPLAEVLLLIKKNKWPIYCDVELEYDVKPWSDAVKEVKTCVNFVKQILS